MDRLRRKSASTLSIRATRATRWRKSSSRFDFSSWVISPGKEDPETSLEERKPISVDKDNFNEVLEGQNVEAEMSVPNRLSGKEDDELSVKLNFKTMRDFEPDAIAQQVPELKKLIELRDALLGLTGPLGNIPGFRKRLQAIIEDPELQKKILEELGPEDDGAEAPAEGGE